MNGNEILTTKYQKGDDIEYIHGSNNDEIIRSATLINIDYKQKTILLRDTTLESQGVFAFHALQDIKINLSHANPISTVEVPQQSKPNIPSKVKPFERVDFALNLYYQQTGRRGYKNEHGKGKFLQFVEENKTEPYGFENLLRTKGKNCDFISKFDPKLFKNKKNRLQKIYDIILYCYTFGYPRGNVYYDPIEIVMGYHGVIREYLNDKVSVLNAKCLPLHKWSVDDIANTIQCWIFNDINYLKNIRKTLEILVARQLSGDSINKMTKEAQDNRSGAEKEMLKFMTRETLQIIMQTVSEMMNIGSRNAAEMGYIMYNVPVNNLLLRIRNDYIDGQKFLTDSIDFMETETGWSSDEIIQIESILYKHCTFQEKEFKDNMDKIMAKSKLPDQVKYKIKDEILEFDVEKCHYLIKNNHNIEEFSDSIITLVEDITEMKLDQEEEDLVKQVYDVIARCFIFPQQEEDLFSSSFRRRHEWHCSNCGNHNFNRRVNREDLHTLEICSLCGIEFTQTVIWKIKGHAAFTDIITFLLTNADSNWQNPRITKP